MRTTQAACVFVYVVDRSARAAHDWPVATATHSACFVQLAHRVTKSKSLCCIFGARDKGPPVHGTVYIALVRYVMPSTSHCRLSSSRPPLRFPESDFHRPETYDMLATVSSWGPHPALRYSQSEAGSSRHFSASPRTPARPHAYLISTTYSALIAYELILTAREEYQVIWKRGFSLPVLLFVINRYSALILGILNVIYYLRWWESDQVSTGLTLRLRSMTMLSSG